MLIAVAGAPGTGTTTLCRILASSTKRPHVYAGQVFRDLAKERGMSLQAFSEFAEEHADVDRELDQRMIAIAQRGECVLEGRMAAWHVARADVPALRVLLEAPEQVRADRVAGREGVADVEGVLRENREREASEAKRYREFYGFDPNDPRHYDVVIDTSDKAPDLVADIVVVEARKRGLLP